MVNIVLFNGGRGASTIINFLKKNKNISITSIINAYDDGKSTGEIRKLFDMLGPSDIRKVQSFYLNSDDKYYKSNYELFNYRFSKNANYSNSLSTILMFINNEKDILNHKLNPAISKIIKNYLLIFIDELRLRDKYRKFNFNDCSLMNCIYAGAYFHHNKNLLKVIIEINKIFNINSNILPNSLEKKILVGIRKNGFILHSESEIVNLRSNTIIDNIYLLNNSLNRKRFDKYDITKKKEILKSKNHYPSLLSETKKAIKNADIIIYCPGTQHSSLYPTYVTSGIADEIYKNKSCLKLFITNIGADYESPVYIASEYILNAVRYLNYSSDKAYSPKDLINHIFINNNKMNSSKNKVEFDKDSIKALGINYSSKNFEHKKLSGYHDGKKVSELFLKIYNNF